MSQITIDNINERDEEGKTPLFDAYIRRDFVEMKRLVEVGADINIPDQIEGSTRSVVYYLTKDNDEVAVNFLIWLAENSYLEEDQRFPDLPHTYLGEVIMARNLYAYREFLRIGFNPWTKSLQGSYNPYTAITTIKDIRFHYALLEFSSFDLDESEAIRGYTSRLLFHSSDFFRDWGEARHGFLIRLKEHPKFRNNQEISQRIEEGRRLYGWE